MSDNPIVCLLDAIEKGLIDKRVGKELIKRSEALTGHFSKDPKKASAIAAEQIEAELSAESIRVGRLGEVLKEERILLNSVNDDKSAKGYINEALNMKYRKAKEGNRTQFGAPFAREMAPYEQRLNTFSAMENRTVIEGIMGHKVVKSPELAGLVRGYKASMDIIHRTFKEYGITGHKSIPKNSMPVHLKGGLVMNVPFKEFRKDMSQINLDHLVENTPYFHKAKGGINEILEDIYNILAEGAGVRTEIKGKYGVSAQDFRDHMLRNLFTGDPDSYISLQAKYGTGETNFMQSHISYTAGVAEYTARHEAFGGDIHSYTKWVKAELDKKGLLTPALNSSINKKEKYLNGSLDNHVFLNKEYQVIGTKFAIKPARVFDAIQGVIPLLLGKGAVISAAVIDPAFAVATKKTIGLKSTSGRVATFAKAGLNAAEPTAPTTFIGVAASLVKKGVSIPVKNIRTNRQLAARSALTIDYYSDILTDTIRRAEDGTGSKFQDKAIATIMRVYGLTPMTNINRQASLLDMSYSLADIQGVAWKDLDGGLKRTFRRSGIGVEDWVKIGKTTLEDTEGGPMLTPETFIETDLKLARKLSSFYQGLKEKSVPSFGSTMDQWKKEAMSVGTFTGIGAKSLTTFQGFAASVWENWLIPAMNGENRQIYASLLAGTTLLGYAQVVLQDFVNGETTNFSDPTLLVDAFVKGGSASFMSEVISATVDPFGDLQRSAGSAIAGVAVGTTLKAFQIIGRNANRFLKDKETALAYDAFVLADKFNPAQSFWLTSELWDRNVAVHIRRFLSQEKARKQERARATRLRNAGKSKY